MDRERRFLRDSRAGQVATARVGAAVESARALESFDRPRWLYRSRGAVPAPARHFRPPDRVDQDAVALCRRLLDAHALAQRDAPPQDGMWSHPVFRERQRPLVSALEGDDPEVLARVLGAMFRSTFVVGMASGSLGLAARSALDDRLWRLNCLNKLVALAESQGTVGVENPEQGRVGIAFDTGLHDVVARTEAAIGASLDFPRVGAAYGIEVGGRLITLDAPDQVYGAVRLRDAMAAHLTTGARPPRVVEIGGGYGGMAYWFLRLVDARYTIVDLPAVGVLQGYFLGRALGASAVSLHGEPPARVAIVPTHALARVETPFDVLANKDSLPEIPQAAALEYLRWAREACGGIVYSYNQEAAAAFGGTAQNVVHELLSRVGGFTRARRDPSWLRRGYAEEVWVRDEEAARADG